MRQAENLTSLCREFLDQSRFDEDYKVEEWFCIDAEELSRVAAEMAPLVESLDKQVNNSRSQTT